MIATHVQLAIMELSSYVTSAVLIVLLIYALLRVMKGSRVSFLIWMIILLIISNFAFIIYIADYNNRRRIITNSDSTYEEKLTIVSFSITFDCIRYLTLLITMWCFSFKYWVVAVEIPKAI